MVELSARDARQVTLAAQGFGARPVKVTARHIRSVATRLGVFQIDAVNVLVRAQYMPAFSRLGPYSITAFDKFVYADAAMFEYTAHALCLIDMRLYPMLRWRMDEHATSRYWMPFRDRLERERPGYIDAILAEVRDNGPLAFGDLEDQGKREKVRTKYAESSMLWWHWSDGKSVLSQMLGDGRLTVVGRRGVERLYDLTERYVPADILATPPPPPEDARRELVRVAARALGVANVKEIAVYFGLPVAATKTALGDLIEAGEVEAVQVEGWNGPAYLAAEVPAPPVHARALVSPFDPLLWERSRTERLFGFRYRIEIYVKAHLREHGYYVLPFLLGDELIGRVDLAADRKRRVLLVHSAFIEPGRRPGPVAAELAAELGLMRDWLGLESIEVGTKGDLAPALAKAVRRI